MLHLKLAPKLLLLSMAVVGLFWKLLYDPSFGIINYFLGLGTFEWLADPDIARSRPKARCCSIARR